MNFKKGQGLSMNVIIIAAIALLILVILVTLVLRSGSDISEANRCSSLPQYQCVEEGDSCPSGMTEHTVRECADEELSKCCVPLGDTGEEG